MRTAEITRNTNETKINLSLCVEGSGVGEIDTGVGFLDHMLTLFAAHGRFDLKLNCKGDLQVDAHHTVEDTGIVLGQAFKTALGERRGIVRYGDALLPMDEALVQVAVDLSGRAFLSFEADISEPAAGTMESSLIEEFFMAFARECGITLHIRQLSGKNAHHIFEAMFKGLARALSKAAAVDTRYANEIPSTKGVL
ncbi:MAG: imidazoleglycerol-phosphate dehydratase HisB [Oscillospiraceae bacterium]|nr:imidazoleglycerol-phosphate dehydratase HisB [Oscillospiraceae bacterium]